MRLLCASVLGLTVLTGVCAQPAGKGKAGAPFGIEPNHERYPQKTPQAALGSVVRVLAEKRYDYLLAHLADPAFVKAQLKLYKGQLPASLAEESKNLLAFQRLAKATGEHFRDDPSKLRELTRFAKDGEWKVDEKVATATLKILPARRVFLKKIGERWYLEDRDKAESGPAPKEKSEEKSDS
jgi:hypothetical protein